MPDLVDVLVYIVLWGTVAWIVGLILQVSDLLNSLLELSGAKDTVGERRRFFDGFGSIAGVAMIGVVLALGLDLSARLIFDREQWLLGVLLVAALVLIAVLAVLGVVALRIRGDGLSYAVLRANLADEQGERIRVEQVAVFRAQLAQIDARKRHIRFGLRDRAGLRPVRARLAQVADDFAVVPPTGFGAVRSVRWKTANAYVWIGNPVRVLPTFFAVVVFVAAVVAMIVGAEIGGAQIGGAQIGGAQLGGAQLAWVWIVGAIVAAAASFLLALVQARVGLAAKAAWHAVYQRQRLDAVKLIEELEKSSRKGVTGLGDRVARALQILRDQQS